MMVLQEEAHHQEEISEKEMAEVLGDQTPETILHVTEVVQEGEEGILATDEVPRQGEWATGLHPEEGHHQGETLEEMMIGEDLLLGVHLLQEEAPLQGVALHPAEDP